MFFDSPVCNGERVEIFQSRDNLRRVEQGRWRREPEIKASKLCWQFSLKIFSYSWTTNICLDKVSKKKATEVLQNLRGNKYSLGETRLKKETNEKELMVDDGICGGWQGGVIETTTVSVVKRGIVFKATSSKTDNRCKKDRSVLTFCVRYKIIFDQKSFLRILKLRVAVRKKWGMRSCRRCGSKAAIGVSLSQSSAVVDLNSYTTSTMPQFEKEIRTFAGQTRRRDRCGILAPGVYFCDNFLTKPCFGWKK